MHACTYASTRPRMHSSTHALTHSLTQAIMHARTYVHTHAPTNTQTHSHTNTHTNTHRHARAHTHTHARTQSSTPTDAWHQLTPAWLVVAQRLVVRKRPPANVNSQSVQHADSTHLWYCCFVSADLFPYQHGSVTRQVC